VINGVLVADSCPSICNDVCSSKNAPTCNDDPNFKVNGKKCSKYLKKKTNKKCKKKINGVLVADSCPLICKDNCQ
jgi:hypothetical protein